jgi:hypothetical protein
MPDGSPLSCPVCGTLTNTLYGSMYGDRTLTCGPCFDDRFFAEHPEARKEAEEHQAKVIQWLTGQ